MARRCHWTDAGRIWPDRPAESPLHALLRGKRVQDITLDAENFAQLGPKVSRVFITENEINFLSFPQFQDSLIIFGAGLDQLRHQFDHVESFLMDRNTLLTFTSQWGKEKKQTLCDLPRLNHEERALYDDLRDNRIRKNLRLEQEMVRFGWVESALLVLTQNQ